MNYQLSADQARLQQDVTAFCADVIASRAKKLEEGVPAERDALMRDSLKRLGKAGWLAAGYGEGGLDHVALYLVGEALARACPATFVSMRSSVHLCAGAIRLFGTPSQKDRYLKGLLGGDSVGALAYSEVQAGSDLGGITAAAQADGNTWLLGGTKDIVVNAPLADVFLVLAWHDRATGPDTGMSLFLVERSAQGPGIVGRVETMGLKGVPIASLSMDRCPSAGILGDNPGQGLSQIRRLMSLGSVGMAALGVGIGTACMEVSTAHAKARSAFGRKIGMYQDVGFKLADMFAYNDLGRMLALRAAWGFNTNDREADTLAACAKLFASEA
ncbi:MAG TPA: acyl-CoA dehydrogenase family protein, partial [Deltaproteobacteria bacterium]|nr:acyl-CoA dehydrogenase family protein [Deltaproteobacteria bacterium]